MKNAILLLSFLLSTALVSAKDNTFKRLDKLYKKDAKQCLLMAKRYMKYRPEKASSYYFASIIYRDKVSKARNAKGKYFHVTKSLNYASKFVSREDREIMDLVDWDAEVATLEETTQQVITELSESEFSDLGVRLQEKVNRYEFMNTVLIADTESPEVDLSNELEIDVSEVNSSPEFVREAGHFYGLPTGAELVTSYSKPSEQEMLRLINAERKKLGMVELVWEEGLANACRYHAADLGTQNYFNHDSHDRINGKLVEVGGTFERIKKFYSATFVNSENIAAGNETAEATYQQWYNSKGHYDNMFNKSSRKAGIGVYKVPGSLYKYYWVFCSALD